MDGTGLLAGKLLYERLAHACIKIPIEVTQVVSGRIGTVIVEFELSAFVRAQAMAFLQTAAGGLERQYAQAFELFQKAGGKGDFGIGGLCAIAEGEKFLPPRLCF
jgi:hypothetical protein